MALRSGQLVILGMFGCALGAAAFGMWYRHQVTRRSLEQWGAQAAVLISRAPKVEALEFDPPLSAAGPVAIDALRTDATRSENVSEARGMLNVRQAFVEDSTFRWQQPIAGAPQWSNALIFSDGDRQAAILFDPAAAAVGSPASGVRVLLEKEASEDLAKFFQEQFAPSAAK
jgi:hypothetical protein